MVAGPVEPEGGDGTRGAVRGDGICDGRLNGKGETGKGKRGSAAWPAWRAGCSAPPTTRRISSTVGRRAMRRRSVSGSTSRSFSRRKERAYAAARRREKDPGRDRLSTVNTERTLRLSPDSGGALDAGD